MPFRHYLEDEDDKPYYTKNSLAFYYEDMERKQKLIESLAKKIAGYDIRLTDNLEAIEKEVDRRLADWDKQLERFPDSVEGLLTKWLTDGTIDTVIQTALIDEKIAPLTVKLAETQAETFFAGAQHHGDNKAFATFLDDDIRNEFYTKFKPIIEEKGIVFSAGAITGRVGTDSAHMTLAQMKEMQDLGVEFVSHSHRHPRLSDLTESELHEDFQQSQTWLRANGMTHDILVYPYGAHSPLVRNVARQYFKGSFDTSDGINVPPFRTYLMNRVSIDGAQTFETLKARVDEAVSENAWIVFMTHAFYDYWDENGLNVLSQIIDYIKSINMDIVTTKEGFRRKGNLVDVGDYTYVDANNAKTGVVDSNGEGYGSSLGASKFIKGSDLASYSEINGHIENFKDYCTTKLNITGSNAYGLGLPLNSGGLLEIARAGNSFGYQTYNLLGSNAKYHRYWNNTTRLWENWEVAKPNELVVYLGSNALTSSDTSSTKPIIVGKITYTTIQAGAPAAGFPKTSAGVLMTNHIHSSTTGLYPYQEFRISGTNELFRRNWNGLAWSHWADLNGFKILPSTDYSGTTLLSGFPDGLSITHFSNANGTGFPSGSGGTLTTYKQGGNNYSYQEFKKHGSWDKFIRYTTADGTWSDWKQFTMV